MWAFNYYYIKKSLEMVKLTLKNMVRIVVATRITTLLQYKPQLLVANRYRFVMIFVVNNSWLLLYQKRSSVSVLNRTNMRVKRRDARIKNFK
jgi:hypothetical protein